jgi:hypothetical protein
MAKNSVLRLLLRIAAAAILLLAASVLHDAACVAQEKPPLARIADLVVRKGYKDLSLGVMCSRFSLAGRTGDGECKGYQVNDDDLEDADGTREAKYGWRKGWLPSFNTFVERGTGKIRIILADHDASLGYTFLVSPEGELLKATLMRKKDDGVFEHTLVAITPDLRAKGELEKSAWIKAEQEIAELPDRKD